MPTEIIVTGCGDCPMKSYDHDTETYFCKHPIGIEVEAYLGEKGAKKLFQNCPLKTDSITIKLKQDETH